MAEHLGGRSASCLRTHVLWAAILVGALLVATPTLAHASVEKSGEFGSGILSNELGGVTVNRATGDIYVADKGNRRVERFDAEGTFIEAWGWGVETGASEYQRCTAACLPGLSGSGVGQFEAPVGIATSPLTGDVYVLDFDRGTGVIQEFSAEGSFLSSFGERGSATEAQIQQPSNEFSLGPNEDGLAVGPDGSVYVLDEGFAFGPRVMVFDAAGTYERSIGSGTAEFEFPHSVAVDDAGDVFVSNEFLVFKFAPSGTLAWTHEEGSFALQGMTVEPVSGEVIYYALTNFPEGTLVRLDADGNVVETSPGQAGEEETMGLAFNPSFEPAGHPSGVLYAVDSSLGVGLIYAQPPLVAPVVTGESVSSVGQTTATLRAQVNPNKGKTRYVFEYGAAGPCSTTHCTDAPSGGGLLGGGGKEVTVSATISGLTAGSTYFYRVVVTNGGGSTIGEDSSFTTFPTSPPAGLPDGRAYEMVSPVLKDGGEVFPPLPSEGNCRECAPGLSSVPMAMQIGVGGNSVAYEGNPFSSSAGAGESEYVASRDASGWQSAGITSPLLGVRGNNHFELLSPDLSRGILHVGGRFAPVPAPVGFDNTYLWSAGGSLEPLVASPPPHRTTEGTNRFRTQFAGSNSGAGPAAPAMTHILLAANDSLTASIPGVAPSAPDPGGGESNYDLYEWSSGALHLVNVLPGNSTAATGEIYFGSGGRFTEAILDHAISNDGSRVFWTDSSGRLYVRMNGAETVAIDDPGKFLTAAGDGSKVLLKDGCLYDLASHSCEADLSQGHGPATFMGILGASESLSRVYFVDTEVLSGGQENANREQAVAGKDNLYVWSAGTTSFIGSLLPADDKRGSPIGTFGAWHPQEGKRTAQVTPDGQFLAFVSTAELTGYDNVGSTCQRNSLGELVSAACEEVFVYNAGSGQLNCASCNPTNMRPVGPSRLGLMSSSEPPFSRIHNLTDNGEVFFESQDVLSPEDTNGRVQDIYEWAPPDGQGCVGAAGCLSILSGGQGTSDSYFFGATADGVNAFFVTRDQLVKADTDQLLDLYDARAGGGIAESTAPAPCEGESCKGVAATTAPAPNAGSSTFSGPENPKPPKKPINHHKKKHHKKKHHKKKHHKKKHHKKKSKTMTTAGRQGDGRATRNTAGGAK